MDNFMTEDEWNASEKFNGMQATLKWKELEEKKRFCLISIEEKLETRLKFETFILHFTDKEGKAYKCYSPSHFIKEIRRNRQQNWRPFFVSHGIVDKGAHAIAQFEITYKEETKNWDIFEHEPSVE